MKMNNMHFENYQEVAIEMVEAAKEGELVTAICYYDGAISLLHTMVTLGFIPACIEICAEYIDGYSKEYAVSILGDEFFIERAWNTTNDVYFSGDADVMFIDLEVLNSSYDKIYGERVVIYDVEDVFACDDDCEECEKCCDDLDDEDADEEDWIFEIRDRSGEVVARINHEIINE